MNKEIQQELLFQLSGYFRKANQTQEQGIAEAMEKMLIIGITWGLAEGTADQELKTREACHCLNIYQTNWQDAIISALRGDATTEPPAKYRFAGKFEKGFATEREAFDEAMGYTDGPGIVLVEKQIGGVWHAWDLNKEQWVNHSWLAKGSS